MVTESADTASVEPERMKAISLILDSLTNIESVLNMNCGGKNLGKISIQKIDTAIQKVILEYKIYINA
jgi:hypothetical protein